jgi:beclin 1-associated autophagy-related key regulator
MLVKTKLSENYKSKIKQKHRNIEILKELIKQKKEQSVRDAENREHLKDYNREMRIKLPKYGDKVYKLEDYVNKKKEDIVKSQERYCEIERELKFRIRNSITQLIQFVFPISRVITRSQDAQQQQSEEISEIAEATRQNYVRGRWILQDSQSELQHIIVAPSLPGSGDYAAYNDWVATNKDGAQQPSSNEVISNQNSGYRISAALTYTAQLLQILSYYLNVRLPYKMTYG